jgi:hypothetical protein
VRILATALSAVLAAGVFLTAESRNPRGRDSYAASTTSVAPSADKALRRSPALKTGR